LTCDRSRVSPTVRLVPCTTMCPSFSLVPLLAPPSLPVTVYPYRWSCPYSPRPPRHRASHHHDTTRCQAHHYPKRASKAIGVRCHHRPQQLRNLTLSGCRCVASLARLHSATAPGDAVKPWSSHLIAHHAALRHRT
jgi:hypothetical protein